MTNRKRDGGTAGGGIALKAADRRSSNPPPSGHRSFLRKGGSWGLCPAHLPRQSSTRRWTNIKTIICST